MPAIEKSTRPEKHTKYRREHIITNAVRALSTALHLTFSLPILFSQPFQALSGWNTTSSPSLLHPTPQTLLALYFPTLHSLSSSVFDIEVGLVLLFLYLRELLCEELIELSMKGIVKQFALLAQRVLIGKDLKEMFLAVSLPSCKHLCISVESMM